MFVFIFGVVLFGASVISHFVLMIIYKSITVFRFKKLSHFLMIQLAIISIIGSYGLFFFFQWQLSIAYYIQVCSILIIFIILTVKARQSKASVPEILNIINWIGLFLGLIIILGQLILFKENGGWG